MMRALPLFLAPCTGRSDNPIQAESSARIPEEAVCLSITNTELEIGL